MRYIFHIPLAVVLIFIAAVILTFYIITQTTFPLKIANFALDRYIESKYNVQIEFAEFGGTILNHIVIKDIRVDTRIPEHEYRIARIERLEAFYDYRMLLKGKWVFDSILVTSPVIVLRSDTTGKILVPGSSQSPMPADQTRPKLPNLNVARFVLADGRFQIDRPSNSLLIDSVYLALAGKVEDGVLATQIDSLSLNYPMRGIRLRELHASFAWSNEAIGVDSLLIATDSSLIIGGGLYSLDSLKSFHVNLRNSHVSMSEIGHALGVDINGGFDVTADLTGTIEDFGGHAAIAGTLFERQIGPFEADYTLQEGLLTLANLNGEMFGGTMRGDVEINFVSRPEAYSAEVDVEGFNLETIVFESFKSDLNGHLIANGSGLGSNSFNMDISGEIGASRFDFVRFDSLSGAISLNTSDMYFHPGFALFYKNTSFTTEGPLDYDGEMNLSGEVFSTQMADFWGDLFIRELSGGGSGTYEVTGPTKDPDIRGRFFGDSCSLYGFTTDSLVADFDIASFLYGQRGNVNMFAWKSDVWNIPADSVEALVEVDSNLIYVSMARVFGDRLLLEGTAKATVVDTNIYAVVDSFLFQFDSLRYGLGMPANVDFLADRILVRNLQLQGNEGQINFDCNYGFDGTIDLSAKTENFYFSPWLSDFDYDSLFAGRLSLDAHMTGALANPKIEVSGGVHDLTLFGDSLGTVLTGILFEDSILTVHDIKITSAAYELTGSARYPLVMNLDSGIVYVPDGPIQLDLKGSGDDLGMVSRFNRNVEDLSGQFNIDMQLYGTTKDPQTKGTFELKNGKLKVYQMANPIEDIQAQISSNGRQIIIEWAEGTVRHERKSFIRKSRRAGTIRAAGEINIVSKDIFDYSLAVVGNEVPFQYDLGEIYGLVDLDLAIRGSDPPLISGDVTVIEAEYFDEFESDRTIAALEAADTIDIWDYNIDVDLMPASVTVSNSTMNMVVDGQVRVLRENARDNYIGQINIVRGNMYVFDLNFQIVEGSYLMFDNVEEPDPKLFIDATWRARTMTNDLASSGTSEVPLQIRGTLRSPVISGGTGSGLSDEDVATMLLMNSSSGGEGGVAFQSNFDQRLQVGAAGYLSSLTGQALKRKLGLETFLLTPVYGESDKIQGAALSLGFNTLPNVYTYVSSLSTDEGKADYGAEYRLGRHMTIGGVYDRNQLWRLNLLLHWEFR